MARQIWKQAQPDPQTAPYAASQAGPMIGGLPRSIFLGGLVAGGTSAALQAHKARLPKRQRAEALELHAKSEAAREAKEKARLLSSERRLRARQQQQFRARAFELERRALKKPKLPGSRRTALVTALGAAGGAYLYGKSKKGSRATRPSEEVVYPLDGSRPEQSVERSTVRERHQELTVERSRAAKKRAEQLLRQNPILRVFVGSKAP